MFLLKNVVVFSNTGISDLIYGQCMNDNDNNLEKDGAVESASSVSHILCQLYVDYKTQKTIEMS